MPTTARQEAPRVQRVIEEMPMPVLHLEAAVPEPSDAWRVGVGGLVDRPRDFSPGALAGLPVTEVTWDFHCVWGWSRRDVRWTGVRVADLLAAAGTRPNTTHAIFSSLDGTYASCIDVGTAARGLIAWAMDGSPLPPDHGAPLRFVPPPDRWAYKGVKWLAGVELTAEPRHGHWETLVGNPVGAIPAELLELDHA